MRLIVAEVRRQAPLPDVIAMEEVDHFEQVLACLKPLGYTGVFAPKAKSPCARSLDPSLEDGCAMFWLESEVIGRELYCRDFKCYIRVPSTTNFVKYSH